MISININLNYTNNISYLEEKNNNVKLILTEITGKVTD